MITAVLPSRLITSPEVGGRGRASGSACSRARTSRATPGPARCGPLTRTQRATASCASANDARADAGEQRGAERRALLRRGALERQAEDRRDDLQPEFAARAAARDAADLGADTERAQELERVAQPVGDALEHRPRRARRGRGAAREPDERAARVGIGCGVRSPARYGANSSPSVPGAQRRRLCVERCVVGAEHAPQPRERAGGAQHHAHRVPRAGHRMAEDVDARLGVRARRREARRRRRPTCRARPRPARARRSRRRARRQPGRPRRRSRSTRRPAAATRAAPRAPSHTSVRPATLSRRRRAACRTRPRRRSRARRSGGGGRSPSAAGRDGSARTSPARACAARAASAR